jgi:hypothetical protein
MRRREFDLTDSIMVIRSGETRNYSIAKNMRILLIATNPITEKYGI